MFRKTVCMLLLAAAFLTLPVAADDGAGEKVICLTFDDGPGAYTAQLLDVLERQGVQATFFLVNTGYRMDELLNRMVQQGHSVGIHSYSHDFAAIYRGEEAYMEDVYAMQQLILEKTGVMTWLVRFPGGSSNTVSRRYCPGLMHSLTERLEQEGFCYVDWNVDSGDGYGCADAERIFQNIIGGIRGKRRAVVLQHDVNGCSIKTVERVIRWGRQNGYVFQALTPQSAPCRHRVQN